MLEVLQEAVMPANLVFTILLLLVLLYWIMVIIGALDFDFLDIDFDSDIDADIDAEGNVDLQGGGFLQSILEFFYVGEVPVMVLVTVFALTAWTISILANHYFNPVHSLVLMAPILAANLVISCFIVKIAGVPLKKMFNAFDQDPNAPRSVMGRICIIITTQVTGERIGQAQVEGKGAPILLNVMAEGDHVFQKGDEALIVEQQDKTGVYLIVPVDLK